MRTNNSKTMESPSVAGGESRGIHHLDVYVPNYCLQGQDLPGHLTWDSEATPEIVVLLPRNLRLKALYNAKSAGIKGERDKVTIKGVEVGGYLGLLFGTKLLGAIRTQEVVTFQVRFPGDSKSFEVRKEVGLFRPSVRLESVPPEIIVGYDFASKTYSFSDKVRLLNDGDGTAIILAAPVDREGFERASPSGIADFEKAFLADLEPRLAAVKADWPDSANPIDEFIKALKGPLSLDKATRSRLQRLFDNLAKRFREDQKFLEAFATALAVAYLRNIQLATELASFMEYLNSIGEGRILLANSIEVLKPRKEKSTLRLKVEVTDLANNEYEALQVGPIEVTCSPHVEIPIHALFGWNAEPGRKPEDADHGRRSIGRS